MLSLLISQHALAFDTKRPEVRNLIDEMVKEHEFKRRSLVALLKNAESKQAILDAMSRPAERVIPWYEYRDRFLTEKRILKGADFWRERADMLNKSANDGMMSSVIVGILGVETMYGEMTGRYRVLDALATLAFDYPPRSDYFRNELKQFLLLAREESVNVNSALGSYAGAMGAPQFMPTSYRTFAVDGNGDGKRDLWNSWDDVVASVANYLTEHGWRRGEPVVARAELQDGDISKFDTSVIALNETVASLRTKGVKFETSLAPDAPAMLVVAQGKDGPEYRVGFNNFFVITRYNRSNMYAMAVYDLGTAVGGIIEDASR
jgi:membrane-bound lytic murein transglycosylase B